MGLTKGFPVLFIICFVAFLAVESTEGCTCSYTHPQTNFCKSDFVILIKVVKREYLNSEIDYKVKIFQNFHLSNKSYKKYLKKRHLYTASHESLCGVNLEVGEIYVVSGRVKDTKPQLSLCNIVMKRTSLTINQLRGFYSSYAEGCECNISYIKFKRKSKALHQGKGKLCLWESSPGPGDCQEQHGICKSYQNKCFWIPSKTYDQCINEYSQKRLLYKDERGFQF